jgi:murein endopeptidase
VNGDDGCGKEVDNWLKQIAKSLKAPQPKPGVRVIPDSERRMITMEQLPPECGRVLDSPGVSLAKEDAPEPPKAAAGATAQR